MRGVRVRLVIWNVLVIGLILAAMASMLRTNVRLNAVLQVDNELRTETESARLESPSSGSPGTLQSLPLPGANVDRSNAASREGKKLSPVTEQDNAEGVVKLETGAYMPKLIPYPLPKPGGPPFSLPVDMTGYRKAGTGVPWTENFRLQNRPFRSSSRPVYVNGRVVAVVQAVRSMEPMEAMLRRFDAAFLPMLPIALLVAAGAGTVLVASAMRPLRILTNSARSLVQDERLPIVGRDEFADLAIAFNTAYDRTARAMSKQASALAQLERFTGDAGHELRTPLAVIKGSVSRLLAEKRLRTNERIALELVDRSADRMTKLIEDLLLLARQDSGSAPPPFQPVVLKDLIESALPPRGERCSIDLRVDAGLRLLGDAAILERGIENLLKNARSYARTQVRVDAKSDGKWIELAISDDGEGIAAEDLPRLGQRFYRPEASRSREHGGVGLGLAITRGIIEAHGGNMEIRSELGVGSTVIVHLPAANPSFAEPSFGRTMDVR